MAMANDKPDAQLAQFRGLERGGRRLLHPHRVGQRPAPARARHAPEFPDRSEVAAKLGLGLILTMAVLGFSSRKQPLNLRTFRNFLILNAVALSFFLLVIWGFSAFGVADVLGAIGVPERAAAGLGLGLIFVASLGSFFVANAHRGAGLIHDDEVAEELRERGRLYSLRLRLDGRLWPVADRAGPWRAGRRCCPRRPPLRALWSWSPSLPCWGLWPGGCRTSWGAPCRTRPAT